MNPWILGTAAFIAFGAGWTANGWRLNSEIAEIKGNIAIQREAAVRMALEKAQRDFDAVRAKERRAHIAALEIERRKQDELETINATLAADLARLRDRPSRTAGVSGAAAATASSCRAANGADLAREYAEFLTRYAALAAEYDAALNAYQLWAKEAVQVCGVR